jgi:hypothetical protein
LLKSLRFTIKVSRLMRVKAKNTTNRIMENMPRNKGSLNKVTQDTKKVLKTVLEGQIDRIELALDDVYERNTVTYLQIITKLLPYLLPKAIEDTTISFSKKPLSWFNTDDDE